MSARSAAEPTQSGFELSGSNKTEHKGAQRLRVVQLEKLEDFEPLLQQFNELLAAMPSASTFSSWEWLAPWWRANGNGNRLLSLAFFDSRGTLVGLAMMYLETRSLFPGVKLKALRLLGDGSGDSDNLDITVRAGYEQRVAHGLMRFLESRSEQAELCVFNTLPLTSPVGRILTALLEKRGWTHIRSESPGSQVSLPATWEAYLTQLSSKERSKIRYYTHRLEKRYRVCFRRCEREQDVSSWLESFFDLHQKRWQSRGEAGSFGCPARRQFYKEIATGFLRRGWLEFWLLELDGRRVAADFNFRYNQTVYALQSGFDPDYADDSVGHVLKAHMLESLILRGIRRYDFLAGFSEHKVRWSAQPSAYVNISFAAPSSRGELYLQLLRCASTGKEWMRDHLPAGLWQFMRRAKKTWLGTVVLSPELDAHLRIINSTAPRHNKAPLLEL